MTSEKANPPEKRGWFSPPRAFVWLALLFGIPLALITAPFQAPDEPQHFLRAYQISEGGWLPSRRGDRGGGDLPVSLLEVPGRFAYLRFHWNEKTSWNQIRDAMRVPLDPERHQFIPFVTAIYSPIAYLPQATGIAIGRQLSLPPLGLMYLARLVNLLAWIVLGCIALRITPICARPLLLLLMMPMSLFQAASMSADATTNGLAVLFTAIVLRFALGRSTLAISTAKWIGLVLLSAGLTVTKFAYLPLAGLVLLIPRERFGSNRRRWTSLAVLLAGNLAAVLLWMPQTHGLNAVVRDQANVSARGQIEYLRSHPSALLTVAWNTIVLDGWPMVRSFVGWLGSMDARMKVAFIVPYLAVLFLACWSERSLAGPLRLRKWIAVILISAVLSIGAVGLLNYIYWTPIAKSHVDGLQGRYLLPLAPAVVYLLWAITRKLPPPPWKSLSSRKLDTIASGIAIFSSAYAIILVYFRYYVR